MKTQQRVRDKELAKTDVNWSVEREKTGRPTGRIDRDPNPKQKSSTYSIKF